MFNQLTIQVEEIIKSFMEDKQLELVDLKIRPYNRAVIIQILADRLQGGITIDECVAINQHLTHEIEKRNLIVDYTLEVSSPGLDRPLKTVSDFKRVIGRNVHFYLKEPFSGKHEYSGTIQGGDESVIHVESKAGLIAIPLEKINKAVQII